MPSFEYHGTYADGNRESGTLIASNLGDAAQQLAAKGLTVERINAAAFLNDPLAQQPAMVGVGRTVVSSHSVATGPATGNPYEGMSAQGAQDAPRPAPPTEDRGYMATSVAGPLFRRIALSQLMFFFRQFATMLRAGVPIVQSLDTLAGQARDPRLSLVIKELKGHVEAGRPISVGMQRYPEVFTPLHLSLIRAGEEAGMLDNACEQIAQYLEQEIHLRNLYRKATFMPKMTVFMSIVIIGATNWLIHSMGKESFLTSPLNNIQTWYWLGPLLIGIFLFVRVGLANPRIRYNWDYLILNFPYLGHTLHQFAMAKFGRAFGALYRGGVPMARALVLSADACGNEWLRAKIHPSFRRLESGAGLTETLKSTGAFSPIVIDMIQTGEKTGNLDQMLTKMSEFYEDEGEVRSKQLGQTVGVVVLILVGVYVLYVLIQGYMGYFDTVRQAGGGMGIGDQ